MNKAGGMDQIPTKFLKEGVDMLANPASRIMNILVKQYL